MRAVTNDVEKRCRGPRTGHSAAWYAGTVVLIALVGMAAGVLWTGERTACAREETQLCDAASITAAVAIPSGVLLLGGIGAFVQAFLAWRRGQTWPLWQGAGWGLFVLAMAYLTIAMMGTS